MRLFTCFLRLFFSRPQSQLLHTPRYPYQGVRSASFLQIPRSLRSLSQFLCWGSAAACVYARLLKRLSCGSVTVFEPMCSKQLLSLLLRCVRSRWIPSVFVPFSSFNAPHTKTLLARPSCQRLCFIQPKSKKLCQSLVQLAEVIPTSSGRSSYPPSAQTRGRLAPQTRKNFATLVFPRFFLALDQHCFTFSLSKST